MQLMSVKNIEDLNCKVMSACFFGIIALGEYLKILEHFLPCFGIIQTTQQPDQHGIMQQFFCHEFFTPVISFSSTMSTDLLSMQVCFICDP